MPKEFGKPKAPAEVAKPTVKDEVSTSLFSPFDDSTEKRKEILGERVWGDKPPRPSRSPEDEERLFAEVEVLLTKSEAGNRLVQGLIRQYRATTGRIKGAKGGSDRESLIDLHVAVKEALADENAEALIVAAIANLSFLYSKLGR